MNHQSISTPVLLGIHRYSTLTNLNPGFGGPLGIFFCKCHLHNASKEVFHQKIFLNSMHGIKNAILAIFQFWQIGTFEFDPVHEIKFFFIPKDLFFNLTNILDYIIGPRMSESDKKQPVTYCFTFFNFQAVGRASLRSSDDIDNCEEIENEMNAIDDRIEVHIESFNVDEQNKVKYLKEKKTPC